jgi:hypothetical protein
VAVAKSRKKKARKASKAPKSRGRKMSVQEIAAELAEVARVGEAFIDGELVRAAWMPYAQNFMAGDDMDYNEVTTTPLKKSLMRLERLSRVPCSTVIWRRRPDDPGSGEAVLLGSYGSPQTGNKPGNRGYKPPRMTRELAAIFVKGKGRVIKVDRSPAMHLLRMEMRGLGVPARGVKGRACVQVYAPIRDSMGEVAGVLEVFTAALGSK